MASSRSTDPDTEQLGMTLVDKANIGHGAWNGLWGAGSRFHAAVLCPRSGKPGHGPPGCNGCLCLTAGLRASSRARHDDVRIYVKIRSGKTPLIYSDMR
jgi:hypothetical protein